MPLSIGAPCWSRPGVIRTSGSCSYRLEGFDYSYAPIVTKSGEIESPAVPPVRAAFAQVAGTNDPATPLACDASAKAENLCRNSPVDEALATFGERPAAPDQSAADVDAARLALAVRPRGG